MAIHIKIGIAQLKGNISLKKGKDGDFILFLWNACKEYFFIEF